jgi:tetratricopeptide (TPR) repeat protein
LEPRGCGTTFRKKNAGYFFKTQKTVGRIAPHLDSPEWALQIPIPQNSRINLLFNGFCGYFNKQKHHCAAEIVIPEPGVLWGRFDNIPAPVLISDKPLEETGGFQWLEADSVPALLVIRDGVFCLVTKVRIQTDAVQLAEKYLEDNLDAYLQQELECRDGATKLFEHMAHHDSLAVISAETMMRSIRPGEGDISTRWSQSMEEGTPHLNTNELHILALAWRHLDIETAEELVLGALKLQGASGAIPVAYTPHETFSVLEAPKPLFAKTVEKIWEIRKEPSFLVEAIPLLRRHLQWLLHHFDPKRRGLHCWQNSNELFNPETYESERATVDLTALLLTEVEALNRLQKQCPDHAKVKPYFPDEYDTLEHNLQTQFWNENTARYSNAYLRGNLTESHGFQTLVPLLWNRLPGRQRNLIVEHLQESDSLPGGVAILSWRKTMLDESEVPLLQQQLLLEILKTTNPQGTLIKDFTRLVLQSFVEWHTLVTEEYDTVQLDPASAAYIINLMETHHYRYRSKGRIAGLIVKRARKTRASWFDLAVVVVTIFAVLSVHTFYKLLKQPMPYVALEAQMSSAYANKNAAETLESCKLIIEHYPDQAAMAYLLAGNILLIRGEPEKAATFLAEVRKEYPDSPGPMIALGLAYQLQGRFKEANENYIEFSYIFEEIFPELINEIQRFRYLMEEGFRTPPEWAEIYRYQLMHEL